ncbi:MAG: response regulator transcription factor [Acidobacteriota bacterium]
MSEQVTVTIVWDQRLFRECLASILDEIESVKVIAQVDDLGEARSLLPENPTDLLLVELEQTEAESLQRIHEITQLYSNTKVMILGLPDVEDEILLCIEAGVTGYLVKDSSLADLQTAIDRVTGGEVVYSPELTGPLLRRLADLARERRVRESFSIFALTPREIEILELIAEGLSNKQIAKQLYLSLFTIKNHVHSILKKLQVKHRFEAVEKAYKKRWLYNHRRVSQRAASW